MKLPTLEELDEWERTWRKLHGVDRLIAAARQRIRLVELVRKALPHVLHPPNCYGASCPVCALRREVEGSDGRV